MTNELIELASKLRSSIELVSREVTGSTSDNVMGLLCVAGDAAAMLRKMTEQKPVATVDADADGFLHFESDFPFAQGRHLLYAAPVAVAEQKPVALSDDAIAARCSQLDSVRSLPNRCDDDVWPAVERALLDVARLYAAPVAAITAEQKPVAWAQVVHDKVWAVFKYKGDAERYLEKVHVDAVVKPLYTAPVAAITAEQKAEVLRLADIYWWAFSDTTKPLATEKARAALSDYLDKIGGPCPECERRRLVQEVDDAFMDKIGGQG